MKVLIVGAGASGMMAAIAAAGCGHEVTVLERNKIIGRKLYITGKGRCNVTNASDISDFFPSIPRNPEFLYSALYTYSNVQLMDWLRERGLKLKTERGQRVFPLSDKSSDVIGVFRRELERLGVTIEYETQVQGIRHTGGQITGLVTSRGLKTADHYILAAGGGSYPLTGSDGGILGMLKGLGIKTQPFTPSLIPLTVKEPEVVQLAGVSLKNVTFTLLEGKRVLYQELGEMLFTHDGVSGPLVLSASCLRTQGSMHCEIDLKPGLTEEMLDARILRDFAKYQNKDLANGLSDLLIGRLIPLILERAKIPPDTKVHSVTKQQRRALLESIKHLTFTVKGTRPLAEAIISRGGVDVSEVDPSTMKLIRYSNGSVCGELIDVDAFTGGYNLQIAISTGHLAGGKPMIALRGATTVTANEAENLRERTLELWDRIRQANSFEPEDIVSVIFTCTRDIDCDYPGKYVRLERGLTRASLLHFNEMNVVGTLPLCIRIQIQLDLPKDRRTIPVYLHEAASLRPDLTQID